MITNILIPTFGILKGWICPSYTLINVPCWILIVKAFKLWFRINYIVNSVVGICPITKSDLHFVKKLEFKYSL